MNELLWWFGQNSLAALLMIPCVMLACQLFRDRPAVQHLFWLVILLKFVTPPIIVWPWSVDELRSMASLQQPTVQVEPLQPSDVVVASGRQESRQQDAANTFSNKLLPDSEPIAPQSLEPVVADEVPVNPQPTARLQWGRIVAITSLSIWLCGAIVCFVSQLRRILRFARMVRSGEVAPSHLTAEVVSVASILRMKAPVSMIVKGIASPFLWCGGAIRLAWPDSLSSQADVERSRSIIAHELAHLRRRDHWITWLELIASTLWWWNPLFWFVRRQLRETAEISCDALAIAVNPASRHEYAELLLQFSSRSTGGSSAPVLALGAGNVASFERRLKMILSSNVSGKLSTRGALTMAFLAVIALPYWSLAQSSRPDPFLKPLAQNGPDNSTNDADPKTMPETTVKVDNADNATPDSSPNRASTLPPNIETLLEWGDTVDGLRGAVMIQTTVQKPELVNQPNVFLVLQNVSDKPIRFCDTQMKKNNDVRIKEDIRTLYLRDEKGILSGFSSSGGTDTDVVLQPREVVMIDHFYGQKPNEKGLTISASMVDVIIHDPSLSYSGSLNLVTAPASAWSGKLTTPATRGAYSATGVLPKNTEAQKLFRYCLDNARLNGDIPGGMLTRLSEKVQYFIEINTGDPSGDSYAKKMQPLVARFEKTGDWSQADVATLFDDIAATTTIPLDTTLDAIREHTLQRGMPLPKSLQNANWGEALSGGLRMAWILEPSVEQHPLGSSLKSRIVLHNSGLEPVAFVTRSFHQPAHSAADATGEAIKLESTMWTTIGRPEAFRLSPGEFCELYAPGIGVGPRHNDDWANIRPGTWILANEGDDVVFQSGDVWLTGDHNQKVDPDWWLTFVKERLGREAPLPAGEDERKLILFRVVQNLFDGSPTPEEAESFNSDKSPEALDNLALLLSKRTWLNPVSGSIKSGPTKFKVLPVDPNAATRPRVALNPGRCNVSEELRLVVTRKQSDGRIVNESDLTWYPNGKDAVPTPIALPDGYNSWAAGWLPGSSVVWFATKDSLSSYDCADPASIQIRKFEGEQQTSAPISNELRAELNSVITASENPKPNFGPPAAVAPETKKD